MDLRNGVDVDYQRCDEFSKIRLAELKNEELIYYDQVICGKNDTRTGLNSYMRELLDRKGLPQCFEKLIILRNNNKYGVFNGQVIYTVEKVKKSGKHALDVKFVDAYKLKKLYNGEHGYEVFDVNRHKFSIRNFADMDKPETQDERKNRVIADFGYAITVHKAQGSEWDNVLVYDDGFGGWGEMRNRWLYTAITRAKKKLLLVVS